MSPSSPTGNPIALPPQDVPSHPLSDLLLRNIDKALDAIGLHNYPTIKEIIYVLAIVGLAFLIGWVCRIFLLWLARLCVRMKNTDTGHALLDEHVLTRCSHIIPPIVIMILTPFALQSGNYAGHIVVKCMIIYVMVAFAIAINTVLAFIWKRIDTRDNTAKHPLQGVLSLAQGVVWIVVTIIGAALVLDKFPLSLLAGLGAFAAALMLIFKDSILGFVAGIQLSDNDMVRVGDWIVVPSTIANGIVVDVSLTTVKVQNWDNTIVTLPPYMLVNSSFQNWRGMSDSGYRLISRSILVDADTVREPDADMIAEISKLPGMADFIATTQKNGIKYDPGVACVNGTASTNLGLLRAYLCIYLLHHPLIGTTQQLLVNLLQPTENGLPLQIYCYTTTAWTAYEAVQSEIFEHVAAVAPKFGLQIFNVPSGIDLTNALEAQKR